MTKISGNLSDPTLIHHFCTNGQKAMTKISGNLSDPTLIHHFCTNGQKAMTKISGNLSDPTLIHHFGTSKTEWVSAFLYQRRMHPKNTPPAKSRLVKEKTA